MTKSGHGAVPISIRGIRRQSIRTQIILVTGLLIVGAAAVFSAIGYARQKNALLDGIDAKLLTAAHLAKAVPPHGYFDRIERKDSVTPELYRRIVAQHNRLCRDLDLQYLWSCMKMDDAIVFTTATSPSKDISQDDHARFLDVHRDPDAFDKVFATMQPDFSSFHNEWGHGRMVLVPFVDSRGRPYCVGASMAINDIHALLHGTLVRSVLWGLLVLFLGLLLGAGLATSFAQPLRHLTRVADQVAHGAPAPGFDVEGSPEVESLANSLRLMHESLERTISALKTQIEERRQVQQQLQEHRNHLEDLVKQRTAELERSNAELQQFATLS